MKKKIKNTKPTQKQLVKEAAKVLLALDPQELLNKSLDAIRSQINSMSDKNKAKFQSLVEAEMKAIIKNELMTDLKDKFNIGE